METLLVWTFRWLARWPLGALHGLGALLGWSAYLMSPTYRRRFRAQAAQAGLDWRAVRPAVAAAGRMVSEVPRLWLRPAGDALGDMVRWEGAEHVEQAHAQGRGLLFLTPHLGCFEITAQAYAERWGVAGAPGGGAAHPVTVLYRPARQPWMRQLIDAARERPGLRTAPTTLAGVRQMLRALRAGEAVGLLPDQVPPEGMGVWAPFFGRPAYTMTLAARLAQLTGATVLLIWGERLPQGRGWRIRVSSTPAGWLTGVDAVQAATRINAAMEGMILSCPQQYLWGYHRYKGPRALPGPRAQPAETSAQDQG